jgi:predicted transposase YbfD/YdcC
MDIDEIRTHLERHVEPVTDPRTGNATLHPFNSILFCSIFGMLAGADNFKSIHLWTEAKQDWLEQFLDFPEGVPSHDTFCRVFQLIDPDELRRCFVRWSRVMASHDEDLVAIDGKTLRGSFQEGDRETALEVVFAWASTNGLVLSGIGVENGHERQGMVDTLEMLDLEGCTVSMDALGCDRSIARKIGRQGGDYLMVVKADQPEMHEQLETFWTWALDDERPDDQSLPPIDDVRDVDRAHGRIETRHLHWTQATEALHLERDWPYLEGLERLYTRRNPSNGETTETVHYLISSHDAPDPEDLLSKKRRHWGVENQTHWVLDVVFGEDDNRSRLDHAAENLALIRRMVMNIIRQDDRKDTSLKQKRNQLAWDFDYFLQIIADGAAANL